DLPDSGEPHPGRTQAGQSHLGLGVGADGTDHLDTAAEPRGGDGLVGALAARGHPPAAAVEGLPRPRMAHHLGAEVDVDRADHRDRASRAHRTSHRSRWGRLLRRSVAPDELLTAELGAPSVLPGRPARALTPTPPALRASAAGPENGNIPRCDAAPPSRRM